MVLDVSRDDNDALGEPDFPGAMDRFSKLVLLGSFGVASVTTLIPSPVCALALHFSTCDLRYCQD